MLALSVNPRDISHTTSILKGKYNHTTLLKNKFHIPSIELAHAPKLRKAHK